MFLSIIRENKPYSLYRSEVKVWICCFGIFLTFHIKARVALKFNWDHWEPRVLTLRKLGFPMCAVSVNCSIISRMWDSMLRREKVNFFWHVSSKYFQYYCSNKLKLFTELHIFFFWEEGSQVLSDCERHPAFKND